MFTIESTVDPVSVSTKYTLHGKAREVRCKHELLLFKQALSHIYVAQRCLPIRLFSDFHW